MHLHWMLEAPESCTDVLCEIVLIGRACTFLAWKPIWGEAFLPSAVTQWYCLHSDQEICYVMAQPPHRCASS